jgi:localization factor PodJL
MLEGEIVSERPKATKGQFETSTPKTTSNRPILFAEPEELGLPSLKDEPLAIKPASADAFIPYTAPINNDYDYLGADAVATPKPAIQMPTIKPISNFTSEIDPDLPLDPGMSRPNLPIEAAITPETRVQDAKSSFIAAARKAAQQAAEESAIALENAKVQNEKNGLFNTAKQAVGGRIKSLTGYRKPILLGLAALVAVAGGATVYKNMSPNIKTVDNTISKIKDEMTTGSNAQPANIQIKAPIEKQAEIVETATPAQEPIATIKSLPQTAPAIAQPLPVAPVQSAKPPRVSDAKTLTPVAADPIQVGTIPQRNSQAPVLPALARPVASNGQNIPSIQSNSQIKTAISAQIAPVEELKTLAESGDARAQYELGSRYVDGLSVARDPKLATQWLEKAAAQGLAPAQYRLGSLYRDGKGLRNDSKLAHSWFKRSAEQGNARAMHNLAVVLAEGVTGAPDYSGAAEWFQKAAEYGIKDSQFNVAILFARGLGVSQDLVQSYKWFAVSAALGDEDAARKRDEVGTKLTPEKLEEAKLLTQNYKPKALDAAANDVQPATKTTPVAAVNRQGNSW